MCKYSANSAGLFSGIADEYSKYPYVAIVIVSVLEMLVYVVYPAVHGLPSFFVCSETQPFQCTEVVNCLFGFFSVKVFCVTSVDLQKRTQELKCFNTGDVRR